ncbi:unnamed protein product [Auanema sp. JU1783]|nr:unnamed protein product [Auanema sp. JU1783]
MNFADASEQKMLVNTWDNWKRKSQAKGLEDVRQLRWLSLRPMSSFKSFFHFFLSCHNFLLNFLTITCPIRSFSVSKKPELVVLTPQIHYMSEKEINYYWK